MEFKPLHDRLAVRRVEQDERLQAAPRSGRRRANRCRGRWWRSVPESAGRMASSIRCMLGQATACSAVRTKKPLDVASLDVSSLVRSTACL